MIRILINTRKLSGLGSSPNSGLSSKTVRINGIYVRNLLTNATHYMHDSGLMRTAAQPTTTNRTRLNLSSRRQHIKK